MRKIVLMVYLAAGVFFTGRSQDTTGKVVLTMAEYEKAKTFVINDPDKDSYVKFENAYILDRNDFGKPYFITGDDGMKKRIDLYKLIRKEGRTELGTIIFYTNEGDKKYVACLPGFKADPKLWEKYFEDIHAIDKEEKNFVLKLSYVLSKELGFQLYRAANGGVGNNAGSSREAGTYGNDICFPGNTLVRMADGSERSLSGVRAGEEIVTVDELTLAPTRVKVKELTVHEVKNYAMTRLLLVDAVAQGAGDREIVLHAKWLEATPNHPMVTLKGNRKAGEVTEGDRLVCMDEATGKYVHYTVWYKTESAGGMQRVYNIVATGGTTILMNGVMVSQK